MLDEILRWLGAGDAAITTMGPVLTILCAMLGGYGLTQAAKFPLKRLIPAAWSDWIVRTFAVVVTTVLAYALDGLGFALSLVVGVLQPWAYTVAMAVIRRRWPWLEATHVAGSASPSLESVTALTIRRGGTLPLDGTADTDDRQ